MPSAQARTAIKLDREKFEELYRTKRMTMIAYATAIVGGDSASAEDAVDEAFADIWKKRDSLSAIENANGWLRQIVRNKAIDYLRKSGRIELHGDDDLFDRQISPARSPEDTALLNSDRCWLERALAGLNGHQREAIVLCYFEGLSLQEIAVQTGASLGTVKTRLFYARKILGVVLNESLSSSPLSRQF